MQLPPFTSQEANGFDTISDFLYPNNNPDPEAIGMFLDGFLMDQKRSQYYHPPAEQAQTMGYLLKALDPAEFSQWGRAFERFYPLRGQKTRSLQVRDTRGLLHRDAKRNIVNHRATPASLPI